MCFLLLLALLLHLGFQVTPGEDLQLQDQQLGVQEDEVEVVPQHGQEPPPVTRLPKGQEVKKVYAFCFCWPCYFTCVFR